MSLDEVKKRFMDEIKLRAYDDKYLDKTEEREILQIAIQQGSQRHCANAYAAIFEKVAARDKLPAFNFDFVPIVHRLLTVW